MKSNVNKSLRRHNKRNHAAVNGIGHMGSASTKLAVNSPKLRATNDHAKPLTVPLFEQIKDGEWFQPTSLRGHKMACCDCGLVHTMNFRIVDGNIQIQAFRDEETTADRRQGLSFTDRGEQ